MGVAGIDAIRKELMVPAVCDTELSLAAFQLWISVWMLLNHWKCQQVTQTLIKNVGDYSMTQKDLKEAD